MPALTAPSAPPVDSVVGPAPRRSGDYGHCADLFAERARLAPGDPRHTYLRNRLIAEYLPVAGNIAARFKGRGESLDDLVQVARTGLIRAVDRFDPRHGSDFLSFAVPTIMGEVRRHFRDSSWSMRVPRGLKELHLALAKAADTLSHELGRAPTPREIAKHLDLDLDTVRDGLLAAEAYKPVSLDAPRNGGDGTPSFADQLADDEAPYSRFDDSEALGRALSVLSARDRDIVRMRFVDELSQSEIAARIGVSQMQVSRLLTKALEKLRAHLTAGEQELPAH
ncbi:SigB/SigF/SigG family RNA polymerase sigma factor [Amycolatopsis sp. cmx-4-68]|uniref:SigB/SigF/SigG family RNA polymerase sigma factor n=1 Tax=Amycolatopsis sp. cmx-4-68 TaxID=2790938 RepID=UPI003978558C